MKSTCVLCWVGPNSFIPSSQGQHVCLCLKSRWTLQGVPGLGAEYEFCAGKMEGHLQQGQLYPVQGRPPICHPSLPLA